MGEGFCGAWALSPQLRPLLLGQPGHHQGVGPRRQPVDLVRRHVGVEADADPVAAVEVVAVADAGVLLAQDLGQVRVAFQADGLDLAVGENGEHLAHDLEDQGAGGGGGLRGRAGQGGEDVAHGGAGGGEA